MKIKFIGTGSIESKCNPTSYLIDDKILIDCGNGIIKQLLKNNIDLDDINTVLITHLHGDHFLDIPFLIMSKIYRNKLNNLKIYCPKNTIETIENLIKLSFKTENWVEKKEKANVEFIEFDYLDNFNLFDNYYISSYEVKHSDKIKCYGFVLNDNNKIIGFSGDSSYCDNIDKIVNKSDISILDTTFINGNEKHMGVDNIIDIINKHNKKVISTHMDDDTRKYILDNKIDNIIVLEDSEEIIL